MTPLKTKSSLKLQCIQTHNSLTKALKEKYTANLKFCPVVFQWGFTVIPTVWNRSHSQRITLTLATSSSQNSEKLN